MKLVMRLSPSVTSGGLPGRRSVLHKAQLAVKYAPVRSLLLGARQQRSAINCLGRRWHCTPSPGRAALPPPASAPTRGSRPAREMMCPLWVMLEFQCYTRQSMGFTIFSPALFFSFCHCLLSEDSKLVLFAVWAKFTVLEKVDRGLSVCLQPSP